MNSKKAIFFDIDGTIWDHESYIPPSTAEAIRRLRENGHQTFICTGRSRAELEDPKLFALGFDGIVTGCGTMIEYHGETVFFCELRQDEIRRLVEILKKHHAAILLEGRDYLYLNPEDFPEEWYIIDMITYLKDRIIRLDSNPEKMYASKISCGMSSEEMQLCKAELGDDYDFVLHSPTVAEILPKGFSKGAAIAKVCDLIGMKVEDSVSFGDSMNDMAMIRDAGIGIAMGNGCDEIKVAADYVTASLHEDGILKACEHFGWI